MKRRTFLGTTALAASALPAAFADEDRFIDTNVYLDEWPFRELSFTGVDSLSASLKKAGVNSKKRILLTVFQNESVFILLFPMAY